MFENDLDDVSDVLLRTTSPQLIGVVGAKYKEGHDTTSGILKRICANHLKPMQFADGRNL